MEMEIKLHKSFEKDLCKIKNKKVKDTLFKYIILLCSDTSLPISAKNHKLKGKYKNQQEFHIGGDILVIYEIIDNQLKLLRIGTHSQLFK